MMKKINKKLIGNALKVGDIGGNRMNGSENYL